MSIGRQRKPRTPTAPQQQQEVLLDVAEDMATRVGLENLNVDEVAEKAGISRRTFYRRFPSKDDMIAALGERVGRRAMKELDRATYKLGPRDTVVETCALAVRWINNAPITTEVLLRKSTAVNRVIKGLAVRADADAIGAIAHTLRRSGATMPDPDLRGVAEVLLRLAASFAEQPHSQQVDVRDEDSVREFARKHLAPLVW